jgi:hypothetical protein
MVSVPISPSRELALTSISTFNHRLVSGKASQTMQASLSYTRPNSRIVSDEVTIGAAHRTWTFLQFPMVKLSEAWEGTGSESPRV